MRITCHILLSVLACCLLSCSGGADARRQLEGLEARNRSGEAMLNDTLAETLAAYFDRHGTANERMRARYMLGRTYYDLGELPRALETYYEATDCADTTAADCDYKVLSRIHAQSARIYRSQIQPRTELMELRKAEYYAIQAQDTLQAIECYSQQGDSYKLLDMIDSTILIKEKAITLYDGLNQYGLAALKRGNLISSYLQMGLLDQAKQNIDLYERESGLFGADGNIQKGREVYYYIKGEYYMAVSLLDSAEYMFRKELRTAKDLNNQIAGSKGLHELYTKKGVLDSIAKYATLSYELNDSAYSLSEMENIQRLGASYNYQHNKQLAYEKHEKAKRAYWIIAFILALMLILTLTALHAFMLYKKRKEKELNRYLLDKRNLEEAKKELEEIRSLEQNTSDQQIAKLNVEVLKLQKQVDEASHQFERHLAKLESTIDNHRLIKELHGKAGDSPYQTATSDDFKQLAELMDNLIPTFYAVLHKPTDSLRVVEYRVCMLVRFHFSSSEIWKLTETSDGYIANLKKRIYRKIFGVSGTAKD